MNECENCKDLQGKLTLLQKEALVKFDCQVCSGALEAENERLIKELADAQAKLDGQTTRAQLILKHFHEVCADKQDLQRQLAEAQAELKPFRDKNERGYI